VLSSSSLVLVLVLVLVFVPVVLSALRSLAKEGGPVVSWSLVLMDSRTTPRGFGFRISAFFRPSDLGLRISLTLR
jgi:hypothetical protein